MFDAIMATVLLANINQAYELWNVECIYVIYLDLSSPGFYI